MNLQKKYFCIKPVTGMNLKYSVTVIALFFLLLGAVTASAVDINVTAGAVDTIDNGNCSLVEAINSANSDTSDGDCPAGSGADTIILPQNITFTLTSADSTVLDTTVTGSELPGSNGLPPVTSEITIEGNGSTIERSSADGTPEFRILAIAGTGNLTLENIVIRGGLSDMSIGGGILNSGILTVNSSTISENSADFPGDSEQGLGAGIFNFRTLNVSNSTISGNSAGVQSGEGGGIGSSGTAAIINSTITDNTAGAGAGLAVFSGGAFDTTIIDSVINAVTGDSSVANTIIAGNTGAGGNCVVLDLDNTPVPDPDIDAGSNLSDDATCAFGAGDSNTSINLDPEGLKDNQGPTPTIALLPGSSAIDAIPPENGTCEAAADQRGFTRPSGAGCDIGAFEVQPFDLQIVNGNLGAALDENSFMTNRSPAAGSACEGFAGEFLFTAAFTNTTDNINLSGLVVDVEELSNNNILGNANVPGGAGAIMDIQLTGQYADGVLGPNETVNVDFVVCLSEVRPFDFFVNILGIVN